MKSMIYTRAGDIKPIDTLHRGIPFFRKQTNYREIEIASLIRKHPHPNIVTFYTISPKHRYIDMEMLDTSKKLPKHKVLEVLRDVKDHLQSLGVMYIDWKVDQVGVSKDNTIKLFDFDLSALIDTKTNKWLINATEFSWSAYQAEARGITDPYEMDNYAFTLIYPPKDFKEIPRF
jgi:hypothetical protein